MLRHINQRIYLLKGAEVLELYLHHVGGSFTRFDGGAQLGVLILALPGVDVLDLDIRVRLFE